jgi:small subunit ribosomal protein S17
MRTKVGIIKSAKMEKTVIVSVERTITHSLYHKKFKRHSSFAADINGHEVKEGDKVEIEETKPVSKTKCWKITNVLS